MMIDREILAIELGNCASQRDRAIIESHIGLWDQYGQMHGALTATLRALNAIDNSDWDDAVTELVRLKS